MDQVFDGHSNVEWPLPLSICEFSLDEDRLILSAYWAKQLTDIHSDMTNTLLCHLYAKARAKNSRVFPKPERYNLYSRTLTNRLDSLLADPLYEPLVSLISRDLALSLERSELPPADFNRDLSILAFEPQSTIEERNALLREGEKYGRECLSIIVPVSGLVEELKDMSPLIENIADNVTTQAADGQGVLQFNTRRNLVTTQSRFLAKLIMLTGNEASRIFDRGDARLLSEMDTDPDGINLVSTYLNIDSNKDNSHPLANLSITLNDTLHEPVCLCRGHISNLTHFDPDNFARFLLFCRHPTVIVEQKLLHASVAQAESYLDEAISDFASMVSVRRTNRITSLAKWLELSKTRLCDEILLDFSEHVKDIRRHYEQMLRDAAQQLSLRYQQYQVETLDYYERLTAAYRSKITDLFNIGKTSAGADQRVKDLSFLEQTIFYPINKAPELLILAEALQASRFCDAACEVIARNIMDPRIFNCDLLARCRLVRKITYFNILKRISDAGMSGLCTQLCTYGGFSQNACENPEVSGIDRETNFLTATNSFDVKKAEAGRIFTDELESMVQIDPTTKQLQVVGSDEPYNGLTLDLSALDNDVRATKPIPISGLAPNVVDVTSNTPESNGPVSHNEAALEAARRAARVFIIPEELIRAEEEVRRANCLEIYRRWSTDAIRQAIRKGGHPFTDILVTLLDKRENSSATPRYDTTVHIKTCTTDNSGVPLYKLDTTALSATITALRRYVSLQTNRSVSSASMEERIYYECYLRNIEGANCTVGFAYDIPIFSCIDTPSINGVFVSSDGYLFERGRRHYTGILLSSKDVIGCGVDIAREEVKFYRNGHPLLGPVSLNPHSTKFYANVSQTLTNVTAEASNNKVTAFDVVPNTLKKITSLEFILDAHTLVDTVLLESKDNTVNNRLDALARTERIYEFRPCVVVYNSSPSPEHQPCLKFNFTAPFMYTMPIGYSTNGYSDE